MNAALQAEEINFDGLVGPTHNYTGLSWGNIASEVHAGETSSPRKAALQGLAKMRFLMSLGLKQGVLPPHERPHMATLKRLGFTGTPEDMIRAAWKAAPPLLGTIMSASPMWTANAATVSPSADTGDGKVHFTPANLVAMAHRATEAPTTARVLKSIFADPEHFVHHDPLPGHTHFGDEGAANHTRLAGTDGGRGVELFVYGKEAFAPSRPAPSKFPARQTLEASQAIARLHGLAPGATIFARQNPDVIDAGVFHNDVISVGNGAVLFYYESAYLGEAALLETLSRTVDGFTPVQLDKSRVSIEDVVKSYVFNSQLVSIPGDKGMTLIAPGEAETTDSIADYLKDLAASGGPIEKVHYLDLRESMQNGGGPACLRLRVVLTPAEVKSLGARALLDETLADELEAWIIKHYRDKLAPEDLHDPALMNESCTALDELTSILKLGALYDFQQD
jgi:succinylarginine dihydrolase